MSNLRLFCKILCVLLVISMLVSLVSCANDTPEEPDTSDVAEETTEAVSTIGVPLETGAAPSVITAEHAIVMSTRQNTTLVGLAQYMGKEIKDRTGLDEYLACHN